MAGKIDKPRPEEKDLRAFVGTGVDIDRPILEEEDDLRKLIEDIVAEAIGNLKIEVEQEAEVPVPDISIVIVNKITELWTEITNIWNTINNLYTVTYVSVYKWVSNHGDDGKYNCYLQQWVSGAWTNVDTNIVVVKNVMEVDSHNFDASTYFHAIGPPDTEDVVPVDVLRSILACSIHPSGSQVIPNAWTETKITNMSVVKYDTAEMYDTGNSQIIVPTFGYYFVRAEVDFGGTESSKNHAMAIYDGSSNRVVTQLYSLALGAGAIAHELSCVDVIKLNANDVISVLVWQDTTGNILASTRLTVKKMF